MKHTINIEIQLDDRTYNKLKEKHESHKKYASQSLIEPDFEKFIEDALYNENKAIQHLLFHKFNTVYVAEANNETNN